MKFALSFLCLLFAAASLGTAQQQPQNIECKFSVAGEPARATITGPEELIPLVYVVEQPDSPLEILSIDFTGMWLSISHEQYTYHHCAKYQVRNRSDRRIQHFDLQLLVNNAAGGGGGFGQGLNSRPLDPGQSVEVGGCNGEGKGGAPGNYVRLVAEVTSVDFGDFLYRPSLRIPRTLGIPRAL